MNTAAAQLRVRKESRELLGGWSKGSDMTDTYDRQLGTAEMLVRTQILDFFRSGGE